jgi:nucleosome binding factor SPN SPT16 subunit
MSFLGVSKFDMPLCTFIINWLRYTLTCSLIQKQWLPNVTDSVGRLLAYQYALDRNIPPTLIDNPQGTFLDEDVWHRLWFGRDDDDDEEEEEEEEDEVDEDDYEED